MRASGRNHPHRRVERSEEEEEKHRVSRIALAVEEDEEVEQKVDDGRFKDGDSMTESG